MYHDRADIDRVADVILAAPPPKPLTEVIRETLDDLDRLRDSIEAALTHTGGTHSFDDVCAMILQGRVRFWPQPNGFLITEVIEYPRQKHYHVWLGGGLNAIDDLIALHPVVQQAAKEEGCDRLTINGRLGWARALKPHGWVHNYTALSLDITT